MPFDAVRCQELAPNVFCLSYEELAFNVGVLLGEDGVLLVDTRMSPVQARSLRSDVIQLTAKPVKWVVNTHYHWDHTFGNSVFADAQLWSHVRCREELLNEGGDQIALARRRLAALISTGDYPASRSSVHDPLLELDQVAIVPPRFTFTSEICFYLGTLTVRMSHLGRGHTDSDLVVAVDQEGVVFAGDLLEEAGPPVFIDSYPLDWPGTVERLLAPEFNCYVPSHGSVMDLGLVRQQHADLESIADLVRDTHLNRMTPEAALKRSPFPRETTMQALARGKYELSEKTVEVRQSG